MSVKAMDEKPTKVIINKLHVKFKYYTIMATKEIKTIALSKNTAELLETKKKLDECYDTLAKVHEDIIGYERGFEDKLTGGYKRPHNGTYDRKHRERKHRKSI